MIRRIPRIDASKEDDRCDKHRETLATSLDEDDSKDELLATSDEQIHAEKEEQPPFQDILADQRRKYDSTQEYVQLIYNDLVKIFVKKWEGEFLRKTVIPNESLDRFPRDDEEENEGEPSEDDFEAAIDTKTCDLDWKLNRPDEMVEIVFVNDNSYTGRISKQKMEGQGVYRWHHGSQYKGSFEDNKIEGKGSLEWQDSVRYDGDFKDGYYHGRGTMVDKNYNLLYIGEWYKGHKHGKGYCRFEKNDCYDGDWVMDKQEGVGNRLYPNGGRYVGNWKNGLRHGTGTMTWPNNDVYEGEWNQGQMHGYGKYTWNRRFKKSLCWPQEACYMGQWHGDTRHGRGRLTLNSIGGAKYFGEWKNDKKHGYGTIIGNNGDVTEGDPLFENNILLPVPMANNFPKRDDENNHGNKVQKSSEIPEARITSLLKPEQCPSLRYYVDRLFPQAEINYSSRTSLISVKCRECESVSCHCLRQPRNQQTEGQDRLLMPSSKEFTRKAISIPATAADLDQGDSQSAIPMTNNLESLKSDEERWAYNCIAMHMPRLRKIYDTYSKIFCDDKLINWKLSMSRLSLWQLWRDCEIHKTSLSLVQIDKYLAANDATLMENPHSPYERIEIWQLIHAFLEVSWHLCTNNRDNREKCYSGRLANGLHKFLLHYVYPNVGSCSGILCGPERDLFPIHRIYQLYTSIGEPHTARQLLIAVYSSQKSAVSSLIAKHMNFTTAGKKLSYSSSDEPELHLKQDCSVKKDAYSFLALRNLGAKKFVQIMSVICPSLKDQDTDMIVNMEYEFTFLEFFEILIEAGKTSVLEKHMQADRKKVEAVETISLMSLAKGDRISRTTIRTAGGSNSTKSRQNKLVKNH